MSKQYKLKNYSNRNNPFGGGPGLPWWKIILSVVGLIALVFVGVSIYKPVYNFVAGKTKPTPPPAVIIQEPEEPVTPPKKEKETVEPPAPEVPKLGRIQGVLMPLDIATNSGKRKEFLGKLPEDTNMIYLELKDPQGIVYYNSKVPEVSRWEAGSAAPLDLGKIVTDLAEKNLKVGVKLSVFSDPIAARGNLDNAIMHSSGVLWIDNLLENGGKPWTTPYSQEVWEYNLALIQEVSDAGVALVVLDHVYLPDDPTMSANIRSTEVPLHQQLENFIKKAIEVNPDVPVALFLYENQGTEGAEGRNAHSFGGDPTAFTPDIFVIAPNNFASLGMSTPSFSKELSKVIWLGQGNFQEIPKIKEGSYIIIPQPEK